MKVFISLVTLIACFSSIAQGNNDWLSGVYGHDNKYASLRTVKIYNENGSYKIYIKNQFEFLCDLEFSKSGNTPQKLTNCISQIPPTPRKGLGSCERAGYFDQNECKRKCDHCFNHWTVVGGNIDLKCFKTKSEEICKGNYKLTSVPTGSGDPTTLTIARKLN
jgi:hypothetical protein